MIHYYDASLVVRCVLSLIILFTEIGNIWNIIYASRQKKYLYVVVSAVLFIAAYLEQELGIEIVEMHFAGRPGILFEPATLPVGAVLATGIITSVLTTLMVYFNFWYRKTNLSPNVVKDCADEMHVGICYYNDRGRVIFQNRMMNYLCRDITGHSLLNGKELYEMVKNGIITLPDGSIRRFDHQIRNINGTGVHELLAYDVTEFTDKSIELRKENEALKILNESLHDYNLRIDDTVKREEILNAKVSIHDEMNRLMLMTVVCGEDDNLKGYDNILNQWKNNVLLLKTDNDNYSEKLKSVTDLAEMLGISVTLEGESIDKLSDAAKEVFIISAREAIANASKHAGADNLFITISIKDRCAEYIFENDGRMPEGDAIPTGGLANLMKIVQNQGGNLRISVADSFKLIINLTI